MAGDRTLTMNQHEPKSSLRVATAAMAVAVFLGKIGDTFSRVWFAAWYFSGLAGFFLFRTGLSAAVRRWTAEGLLERRAVIVGGGRSAELLIRALEAEPDNDIRIC